MNLKEMKKKILALIEEIDTAKETLTSDPDIEKKLNFVINQVQFELARMKKIPAHEESSVSANDVFTLTDLEDFYQLRLIRFKNESGEDAYYELIDNVVIFSENGTATFFYYKYPKRITDETKDTYKFELSDDALEIMPYGVAADLLKSDVSAEYGANYEKKYETMLQRLDSRHSVASFFVEGGVDI